MYAAHAGAAETVSKLLERGAKAAIKDRSGKTAMTWATAGGTSGHEEALALLQEAVVAQIEQQHSDWLEETELR